MTKPADEATLHSLASKVHPPFTSAETALALRRVETSGDPVAEAERILDERVGLSARAIRERDGDPYPALDTLLDPDERKGRAAAKIDAETKGRAPAEPKGLS